MNMTPKENYLAALKGETYEFIPCSLNLLHKWDFIIIILFFWKKQIVINSTLYINLYITIKQTIWSYVIITDIYKPIIFFSLFI